MTNRKGSKSTTSTMFSTRNDLTEATRKKMIDLLNQNLANIADLYSQSKQAHWMVKGAEFFQLHKLFDEIADGVEGYIDVIAERITALGGTALGTVRMAAAASVLPEFPTDSTEGMKYVTLLADRYALAAKHVRKAIDTSDEAGDMGTSDLFVDIVRDLDKFLYFLEAHLQLGTK